MLVRAPCPLWGVLCWRVALLMVVQLRCCVAPIMVGLGVLVRSPPHGEAYVVPACPLRWLCVVWCCLPPVVVVCTAWQQALLGLGWWCLWWCFSERHARLVLFVQCCLRCLTRGVLKWLWSAVGLQLLVCWSPVRGWFCAGARPPSWWGVLCLCVPPFYGGACCVGVPPTWFGVLRWFLAPLMVGCAVLVSVGRAGGAWCGGVWLGLWLSVGLWLRLCCLPGRVWFRAGVWPCPS